MLVHLQDYSISGTELALIVSDISTKLTENRSTSILGSSQSANDSRVEYSNIIHDGSTSVTRETESTKLITHVHEGGD